MAKQKRTPGEGPEPRKPSESRPGESPAPLDWRAAAASLPRIMAGSARSSANLARAQAIVFDAFDADFDEQVSLALQALDISPDCADAYVVLAEHASSLDEALDLYRQGVEAGQRAIGKAFGEHEGAFWKFLETRSYLRARLGWAQCLWDSNRYDEAIENYRELLRLDPHDHQGVRYLLASALLDLGRDDELQQLLERYPKDGHAEWLYTAALVAYRKLGDSPRARQLLLKAVKRNRYVPECLLDFKHAPIDLPDDGQQGSEEEAVCCAAHGRLAWRTTPQAIAWLRKVLRIPVLPPPVTRAPDWRRLQRFLGELPQVQGEVWQVDSRQFAEKIEIEGASGRPWLIVVADQSHGAFLAVEAGEGKPTPADVWHHLVEAMLKPRMGDPRRPQKIVVRLKSYHKAWQKKLAQIGVACEMGEPLELVELAVAQTRIARAADRRDPRTSPQGVDDATDPRGLPQEIGEAWQADLRRLLGWVEDGGEVLRPCGVIVTQRESQQVLTYDLAVRAAPPDWLWQTVARAMCRPLRGQPHRPGVIEVASEEQRAALRPHLEACGVQCVVAGRLEELDVVCEEMSRSLNRPVSMTALVDVPGVTPDRIAAFYAAAAGYYRRMPWRCVSGNVPIEIGCDKFQSGPWYAMVLGEHGITLGLALYEGLGNVEAAISDDAEAEHSRHTSAITVTFGEAFEMPIRDLDAAEHSGWPLASPDAYPCAMRVNPGRTVRPLLAWELELLEGCLRAIPDFVAEEVWESVRTVPAAAGELTLQLAWVAENDK